MKLFNAQSAKKQVKNNDTTVVVIKTLENKVLVDKDLLTTVAGGINEMIRPWPPVKPV